MDKLRPAGQKIQTLEEIQAFLQDGSRDFLDGCRLIARMFEKGGPGKKGFFLDVEFDQSFLTNDDILAGRGMENPHLATFEWPTSPEAQARGASKIALNNKKWYTDEFADAIFQIGHGSHVDGSITYLHFGGTVRKANEKFLKSDIPPQDCLIVIPSKFHENQGLFPLDTTDVEACYKRHRQVCRYVQAFKKGGPAGMQAETEKDEERAQPGITDELSPAGQKIQTLEEIQAFLQDDSRKFLDGCRLIARMHKKDDPGKKGVYLDIQFDQSFLTNEDILAGRGMENPHLATLKRLTSPEVRASGAANVTLVNKLWYPDELADAIFQIGHGSRVDGSIISLHFGGSVYKTTHKFSPQDNTPPQDCLRVCQYPHENQGLFPLDTTDVDAIYTRHRQVCRYVKGFKKDGPAGMQAEIEKDKERAQKAALWRAQQEANQED